MRALGLNDISRKCVLMITWNVTRNELHSILHDNPCPSITKLQLRNSDSNTFRTPAQTDAVPKLANTAWEPAKLLEDQEPSGTGDVQGGPECNTMGKLGIGMYQMSQ